MKYVINYSDNDQLIELPEGASISMDSMKAGGDNSHISVLTISDKDHAVIAVFVGAMRIYPVDLEPVRRTWAR